MYGEHSSVTDIGVVRSFILQQEGKRDVRRAQLCNRHRRRTELYTTAGG